MSKMLVAAALAAIAIAGGTGPSAQSRSAICVVVDPVLALGCRGDVQSQSRAASVTPSGETAPSDGPVVPSSDRVAYDPRRIGLTARPGASGEAIRLAFARAHVELEQAVPVIDSYLVRVAPGEQAEALRSLRASSVVEQAGREIVSHALDTTPDDTEWPLQAGLRVVGFPRVWDTSRGSARVIVAVVDTGVDPNQSDLRGALVGGVNFVQRGAAPNDDHGHGTAVAGIIAARSNNRQGLAGICWTCSVMPVKVLDRSGSGDDTQIAAGIVWAVDHGAQVVNLSLGGPGDSPELDAALDYAVGKGVVVVAAAGNSGTTVPFFPAANPNVLSVAATTTLDRPYSWSNYGPWVNVAAPGCNIAPVLSGGYGSFCGTSSATPVVAGLAALARSVQPGAGTGEIVAAIEHGATPLPGFVAFGRIDAPQAMKSLTAVTAPLVVVRTGVLDSRDNERRYDVQAGNGPLNVRVESTAGSPLTVTLVSGQTGAPLARVRSRPPLQLSQAVTGPVTLVIRGTPKSRISFVLTLSFVPRSAG
jgi:subtilisin family serine protease